MSDMNPSPAPAGPASSPPPESQSALPPEPQSALPPEFRFLKRLVTLLAGTMILGLITLIALLVIRLPGIRAPEPAPALPAVTLPATVTLPAGTRAEAVTFGPGWIAVVTDRQEILILDAASGAVRQRIAILPAAP